MTTKTLLVLGAAAAIGYVLYQRSKSSSPAASSAEPTALGKLATYVRTLANAPSSRPSPTTSVGGGARSDAGGIDMTEDTYA